MLQRMNTTAPSPWWLISCETLQFDILERVLEQLFVSVPDLVSTNPPRRKLSPRRSNWDEHCGEESNKLVTQPSRFSADVVLSMQLRVGTFVHLRCRSCSTWLEFRPKAEHAVIERLSTVSSVPTAAPP